MNQPYKGMQAEREELSRHYEMNPQVPQEDSVIRAAGICLIIGWCSSMPWQPIE
jgi:hypothetical protein